MGRILASRPFPLYIGTPQVRVDLATLSANTAMNEPPAQPIGIISDLRKLVFDEFKLAQDKIDRIGEFLFKIRAWAITGNSGLIVGVLSDKFSALGLIIGIVATFAFWYLEQHQRYLRDGYSDRAMVLEAALAKLVAAMAAGVSENAIVASVVRSLRDAPGIAASSRRDFAAGRSRSTNEDYIYAFQIILLMVVLFWSLCRIQITQAFEAATNLGAIGIQRGLEVVRCG